MNIEGLTYMDLIKSNDRTYRENAKEFKRIFRINLKPLWDNITGFDIVRFDDEFIKSPDGQSMKGAQTRIPCSISYQFLIRNDRVYCHYYIRSNDYFKHFAIDIFLAAEMINYITKKLKSKYPKLKTGSLTYFGGSLHGYNEDLKNWVIY